MRQTTNRVTTIYSRYDTNKGVIRKRIAHGNKYKALKNVSDFLLFNPKWFLESYHNIFRQR